MDIVRSLAIVFVVSFALMGCQEGSTLESRETYERLCDIYEQVARKSIDLGMKESLITEKVYEELPECFDKNFSHVMYMDSDERYRTIKRLAEECLGERWSCPVMKSYYDDQFEGVGSSDAEAVE